MRKGPLVWLLAVACVLGTDLTAVAQRPDLSGNYILNGGTLDFEAWRLTAEGQRRHDAYDFMTDDPALRCIAASWARAWMNPNVVVRLTQSDDHVRLQYEFMDIDRVIPLVDPATERPARRAIAGQPALGRSAAWYDGDTLVIDTIDAGPGYVSTIDKYAGLPQSPRMHLVERLSRDADGALRIVMTHVDPAYYQQPLVVTQTYPTSDFDLMEYGCDPAEASVVAPN